MRIGVTIHYEPHTLSLVILYEWRSHMFTTHAGITRRFFFPSHHQPTSWIDGMRLRAMFYRSKGKPLPSLQCTITEVEEKTIKLTPQKAYTSMFTMWSGKGLQCALWIATSAVFGTSVSRQTILNFAWPVVMQSTPFNKRTWKHSKS